MSRGWLHIHAISTTKNIRHIFRFHVAQTKTHIHMLQWSKCTYMIVLQKHLPSYTSWWFQSIWKIWVKLGSSSPIFVVKINKYLRHATTWYTNSGSLTSPAPQTSNPNGVETPQLPPVTEGSPTPTEKRRPNVDVSGAASEAVGRGLRKRGSP